MHARLILTRLQRSLLLPPLVILLVIVVLGLSKLNGSSIALHESDDPSAQALLEPRPIRTDEWVTRTPLVVRQATLDFPKTTVLGIGTHDTGALSDLPVKSVSAVIKPHSWGYFVLDVERAFAMEWWLTVFGPLIGVYAIVVMLTRERVLSLLSGLLVAASPAAGWWTIPSMGFSALYGGVTVAFVLAAWRRMGWKRYACAAIAGWTAAAFASVLYLPWLLPLALMSVAIVLSQVVRRGTGWREWVSVFATTGGVFAVLMAVFLKQHQVALQAIANSVYPGDRVVPSGEARPVLLFGSPFDVFATSQQLTDVSATNQSEAASGLMLWLPIAVVGGAFGGFRSSSSARRALAAVMVVAVALAAWALLPVPQLAGGLLGLTRVQGSRLAFTLTIAGAIAAGLYVHSIREDPSLRPTRDRVIRATLTFAFVTGWVATQVTVAGRRPSSSSVLILLIAICLIAAAILAGRMVLGLGAACLFLLFGSVRINPLQVGLDPVTDSPLMGQIDEIRTGDEAARWAAIGPTGPPKAILAASGAPTVNGTSWYADPDAWHLIDPNDQFENAWNRYSLVSIALDDSVAAISIELPVADAITIRTPSCNGALQALDTTYVITDDETVSPCLELLQLPAAPGEKWIYQVIPPVAG